MKNIIGAIVSSIVRAILYFTFGSIIILATLFISYGLLDLLEL